MRWLVPLAAAVLVIAAGWVAFLNSEPVDVNLAPGNTATLPLSGALLAAFGAGAVAVGLIAGARASSRAWRQWRERRAARRQARREQVTEHARELVWAGEYAQARAELLRNERTAIPSEQERIVLLAETHINEGHLAAARQVLDEALIQVGLEPHLLDLLAEVAERQDDLRGAADALERARGIQPASPRLARRLRDVYIAAGRWQDAVNLQGDILMRVREPAAVRTEEQTLRGLRYQAALAESDPRQAVRLLAGLAREDPTFVPAWVSAGDLLARNGRRLAARRTWERGARRRPAVPLVERIERLNASEGRPERTTRLYRRLRRRHPDARGVALLFARHLIGQGAYEEASDVLSALPAPLAGHPLAHTLWAELHRRRGNHHLAADTFVRACGPELGVLAPYRCDVCRHPADAWAGHCPSCHRWGTYAARAEQAAAGSAT